MNVPGLPPNWATMPGSKDEPNRQVAAACAEALTKVGK